MANQKSITKSGAEPAPGAADGRGVQLRKTTCNRDCADACSIVATVQDGTITHLGGDKDHPVTQGFLCYRTSHFLARQYAPERLTTPWLRRSKNEPLTAVSFDEAMDYAAEKLLAIRRQSGPAAIFHYRSGGSLGHLKYVTDYFWERFGPVTIKRGDICTGAGDAAQLEDFGLLDANDLEDLENARTILIWGRNVVTCSPHTIPVLKRAKAKGTKLILIDPIHHQTARLCDEHVQVRPGGDLALALAVGRRLFECGATHPAAADYCEGLDGFRALCMASSMATWLERADVSLAQVEGIVRGLTEDAPCTFLVGWGMARRKLGSTTLRAIDAVAAVSGNIGVSGAGVSYYYNRKSAVDTSFLGATPPRTICEPRFGHDILAQQEPPIRAVWITAGNPVCMLPDAHVNARALQQTEFVVVVDAFFTDTAACADLILPCCTLLEDDDVLGAYGHHYLGVSTPVVAPPGEVKSDLQIIQALAARTGLAEPMAGSAAEWKHRLMAPKLAPHGVDLASVAAKPTRSPLSPRIAHAGRRFQTPSGRARLLGSIPPGQEPSPARESFPLTLLSCATPDSQSSQWVKPADGPLPCTVHPDAAAGFTDGEVAWLESALSAIPVCVRIDAAQRRDVAIVPKGGHLRGQRSANQLIGARLTDQGEGAALYDEGVRLVREPQRHPPVLHLPGEPG